MLITYLMALGDFTHIVVGSAEVSYLVFAGELGWKDFWFAFAGPTLAGNIIGGSFIFALISHAQIRSEKDTTEKMERDRKNKEEKTSPGESAEAQGRGFHGKARNMIPIIKLSFRKRGGF
ncbi:hypothetical protein IBA8403_37360 [Pseudomonas syringae]